ncbi:MAG: hypothetical protein HKM93_00965 [Desulfobacteraceae bacterium]|nr:hypothetical protein [Desulfobacteraceae bacterium]
MSIGSFILNITPYQELSILICLITLLLAMYFARKPFHRSMASFSKIIHSSMRLSAFAVARSAGLLRQRNKAVLMAAGLESADRALHRELERMSTAIERDLGGYPQLQRQLTETIVQLEEDYTSSAEIPQALPDWVKVIKAVADIKPTGDSMVAKMLEDINETLQNQHRSAVEKHREDVSKRHGILSNMMPSFRSLNKNIEKMSLFLADLIKRAKTIDLFIDEHRQIRQETDGAGQKLSSSSLTQFFTAGLVLLIAFGGAVINFNLIALPMSEMVGGGNYIGPFKTSDVAGLVIILIEVTMGLFLMESLRITRLFPVIGSMDDRMRRRMIWITFSILFILAGVESALAFMRDRIAADMAALRQTLAGVEQSEAAFRMIPTYGQMIMGFILPFALTFVAIPLESFISSSRTVLGYVAVGFLLLVAFLLRLIGNLGFYMGRLISNVYDMIIYPAIWVEGVILAKMQTGTPGKQDAASTKLKESPLLVEEVE